MKFVKRLNQIFWAVKYCYKAQKFILMRNVRAVLMIFLLELEMGLSYRAYIKTAKNGDFCEDLFSENDFEAVLVTFCCYDHGVKASEVVQKIATDQK